MKYIIGNWKANRNIDAVTTWANDFKERYMKSPTLISATENRSLSIVIAPPFPFLSQLKNALADLPYIAIASQTVSQYANGAYTGEVTGEMLKGLVTYTLVGHSERRMYFNENVEQMKQKLKQAASNGIKSVYCIRSKEDLNSGVADIIAFEPVESIGTGMNMPVEEVIKRKKDFGLDKAVPFLYGGSVKPETASSYLAEPSIDGLLIGGASLVPESFISIAEQACE